MARRDNIDAGKLDRPITIQQKTSSSTNELNEAVYTWTTFASVWALVRQLSGRELVEAQQVAANASIELTIRYFPGVAPAMRVLYQLATTRYFDISAVNDIDDAHQWMILTCTEVIPEAE